MARILFFIARQAVAIFLAAMAYFGVRGLTEGGKEQAYDNALWVLEWEQRLHLDFELGLQRLIEGHDFLITLANWIYIFGHWPIVVATLVWLALTRRDQFFELRNALFISGAIGLVIFATWAVMPPRLHGAEYVDTVTIRSTAYRILQPPALVNKYAAVPSLHFGWNFLVGIAWYRATSYRLMKLAAVLMPVAMAYAVVATANHWVADVLIGGVVAGTGLVIQRNGTRVASHPFVMRWRARVRGLAPSLAFGPPPVVDLVEPTEAVNGADIDGADVDGADVDGADVSGPGEAEPQPVGSAAHHSSNNGHRPEGSHALDPPDGEPVDLGDADAVQDRDRVKS